MSVGPAWEAIKWEPRLFESQIEASNSFKGPPRPELDEAWNKLLGPTSIRVNKETLDRINRTSVPLLDGSGYMAGLDVYHQLHCLVSLLAPSRLHSVTPFQRYVRRYLHKDYYNMTEEKNLGQHIGEHDTPGRLTSADRYRPLPGQSAPVHHVQRRRRHPDL